MFQQLMSNPDIMRQLIMANPQMRELMDVSYLEGKISVGREGGVIYAGTTSFCFIYWCNQILLFGFCYNLG